jgi:hypothetical protein
MSNPAKNPRSSSGRVAAYRARMREKGFVPKTIWVPNLKDPAVLAEYQRHARLLASREEEHEALAFIGHAFDWPPEDTVPDFIDTEKQ